MPRKLDRAEYESTLPENFATRVLDTYYARIGRISAPQDSPLNSIRYVNVADSRLVL